jgi:hypothetical protein
MEDQTGLSEIYRQYYELRLLPTVDLNKLERLVFWHHDDTVQPGATYRYRIRLGVLNPAAGTHDPSGNPLPLILWTRWSDPTTTVSIPQRQYIFPKNWDEARGELLVEICKFYLGYWRSRDFLVSQGETIGRLVDVKADQRKKRPTAAGPQIPGMLGEPIDSRQNVLDPDEIDFSTGAVFVGVNKVDGWAGAGSLKPQSYFEVLCRQGDQVVRLPVGLANWPDELKVAYGEIKRQQRISIEPPRPWSQDTLMPGLGPGYQYMIPGMPLGDRGG